MTHSIVYEVCTIIRVTSRTLRILYYGSLYEIVYSIRNEVIPVTAYTSNRLYEYPPHHKHSSLQTFVNYGRKGS
jgi:hypothetical protein